MGPRNSIFRLPRPYIESQSTQCTHDPPEVHSWNARKIQTQHASHENCDPLTVWTCSFRGLVRNTWGNMGKNCELDPARYHKKIVWHWSSVLYDSTMSKKTTNTLVLLRQTAEQSYFKMVLGFWKALSLKKNDVFKFFSGASKQTRYDFKLATVRGFAKPWLIFLCFDFDIDLKRSFQYTLVVLNIHNRCSAKISPLPWSSGSSEKESY